MMMNKKEILKKAGGILAELNEQFEYLSQSPDNLNELELELFSANANFLSDHLSILVKLNDNSSKSVAKQVVSEPEANEKEAGIDAPQTPDVNDEKNVEEKEEPMVREVAHDKESSITFDFEDKHDDSEPAEAPVRSNEEEPDEDPVSESYNSEELPQNIAAAEETSQPDNSAKDESGDEIHLKEVVISEKTIVVPTEQIADEIPIPTVNDMLSKNLPQQTVGSQFNSRQNQDLKGMISLNDKLLFVRDLFNGYSLAYSEAIELLNRFDSIESADNFLKQNYAPKNNWAEKQEVVDKFYEILNRRFAR